MHEWVGGWKNGWVGGCLVEFVGGWVYWWMDGKMYWWMDGYLTGWVDGWRDGSTVHFYWHQFIQTAGTDTTRYTMMWILQYMVMHPDMQAKVQQEIDNVVGKWWTLVFFCNILIKISYCLIFFYHNTCKSSCVWPWKYQILCDLVHWLMLRKCCFSHSLWFDPIKRVLHERCNDTT